jgi:hypothetical protein
MILTCSAGLTNIKSVSLYLKVNFLELLTVRRVLKLTLDEIQKKNNEVYWEVIKINSNLIM